MYESHTGNLAPRSTSLLNRILVGRRDDDDKQPRIQQAWFLGLIACSDEVVALHPDGVQRHHDEWRVSSLDDPESNLRELESALALMTEVNRRTPGCKTCQDVRYHKGWHSVECRERVLPTTTVPDTMWPVARLLDTGADDARDDHESKRHNNSDDIVPMAQEPSSGSGVKRSNLEAIRRADAEAEKALKRAKALEERRAAKRASATPMDELEESATNAEVSAEAMMIAAEAVLTQTREIIEALTVSALQQAHEMSHRPETTVESFFQAHKDMTVTSKEQARQKQLDFLESLKVFDELYKDELRAGIHVMSGRWGHDENSNKCGDPCTLREVTKNRTVTKVALQQTATIQGIRMLLAKCLDKRVQGTRSFCDRLHTSFPQR